MSYIVLGLTLAAIDVCVWIWGPAGASSHSAPALIGFGLPLFLLFGILRRPSIERRAIVAFAATSAVFLNRNLICNPTLEHIVVLAGSASVVSFGYDLYRRGQDREIRSLVQSAFFVLVGFAVAMLVLWLKRV